MEVHLDPLGGWAGDMFAAACLDAFPELWPRVEQAVAALELGPGARCRTLAHSDGVLTGKRFVVATEEAGHGHPPSAHGHHHHPHDHEAQNHKAHGHQPAHAEHHHGPHRTWRDIRALLEGASLPAAVAARAIAIFQLLAEAEAEVHGVEPAAVAFHEVGAIDSIVDIVAAAALIEGVGATRWTSAPLPLGGGRVRTAHGLLPVPAPATALLLRGLPTLDDGIGGERVTPTGAAIARHLLLGAPSPPGAAPRVLRHTGHGFGTRTLPGVPNCLRLLAFEEAASPAAPAYGHRELAVISFEVDDQSAEELALGLEHIRALDGVHDVIQSVAFGKKNRMATHCQVLVVPERLEAAIAACFTETTTIGLRHHVVRGAMLRRRSATVEVDGRALRVKAVVRPDGRETGKTEAADVAGEPGHAHRAALRRAGEATALTRNEDAT